MTLNEIQRITLAEYCEINELDLPSNRGELDEELLLETHRDIWFQTVGYDKTMESWFPVPLF
jgi:hypothetical protein